MKHFTPASIGERLLANILDTFILLLPNALLLGLTHGHPVTVVATFSISLAYYVYFTASHWQATPAKRLLGIYVIRRDGQPLDQAAALQRFLAYSIPSLPMYSSLLPETAAPMVVLWLSIAWFTPILFTPERVGYHDRLCHTRVVAGRPSA